MNKSMCLFANMSCEPRVYNFNEFSVHVAYGRGLVLLWQHCDTLFTYSFVIDVIFAYNSLE